ncbi:MAG: SH3 domain-containing protein [Chloroflexi bacterium]|nr:SH3 domain-containing protein [Chloroflexota bacterium]
MPKILLFTFLLWSVTGCALQPSAKPTPIIIVITATLEPNTLTPLTVAPNGKPSPTPSRTPIAALQTPGAAETIPPNLVPTDVKYVRALQDINIRSGPGTNFEIVGGVYAGQIAKVTGYTSADKKWWRVVCPTQKATTCWVSADPALTEPTDAPGSERTPPRSATQTPRA